MQSALHLGADSKALKVDVEVALLIVGREVTFVSELGMPKSAMP